MRALAILLIALIALSLTGAEPRTRFLHPVRPFAIAGPAGAEIHAQAYIARHEDNRRYRLDWLGECGGAAGGDLDGEYAPAVQPTTPVRVRVYPGTCEFRLFVFDRRDRVREYRTLTFRVCGAPEDCE